MTDELARELEALYERCKFWPERSADGQIALLELRNLTPRILAALSTEPAADDVEQVKLAETLVKIADASRRDDGSDIPLGEYLREAAAAIVAIRPQPDNDRAELLAAIEPVLHWYQSDEHEPRELSAILTDIVADLQHDRAEVLKAIRPQPSPDVVKAVYSVIDNAIKRFDGPDEHPDKKQRDYVVGVLSMISEAIHTKLALAPAQSSPDVDALVEWVKELLAKATPGPWQWVNDCDVEQTEAPHHSICECIMRGPDDEWQANAQLIALAPEMASTLLSTIKGDVE